MRYDKKKEHLINIGVNVSVFALEDTINFLSSSHLLRALPFQKLNGSNVLGSVLVYQVALQLIFVCNLCTALGFPISSVQCLVSLHADS